MILSRLHFLFFALLTGAILSACTATRSVMDEDFRKSKTAPKEITQNIPNYTSELQTVDGKGRAIVSEPGGSDRVTIDFIGNQQKSLLTIQNRIGIEGGKMLVDEDSILIYNRIDKVAQKISIYDGRMTSLNELASVNLIDLLNFKVDSEAVASVFESNNSYLLRLKDGSDVYVSKGDGWVDHVIQSPGSAAPYSEIIYESYGELNGFTLPRKITIFSADQSSRVVFLIRDLKVNTKLPPLEMNIPENISIYRR